MCGGSVILSRYWRYAYLGDINHHFSFYAFGDFIVLRAQKNKEKKGRPCGGLAQRKTFVEIVRQKVACTVEMP